MSVTRSNQDIHKNRPSRRLLLSLSAVAIATVSAAQGERVEALPPMVTRAVDQAQNHVTPPLMMSPATLAVQNGLDARIRTIGQQFAGDVCIAVKDLQTG